MSLAVLVVGLAGALQRRVRLEALGKGEGLEAVRGRINGIIFHG
jgi:hypothetical protein